MDRLRQNFRHPFSLVVMVAVALFLYVFYSTPLKRQVEDYFYDLRSRIKPQRQVMDDMVIVAIDGNSLKALEGDPTRDLSFEHLQNVVALLHQSSAKRIGILALSNAFDYQDPRWQQLTAAFKEDQRFVLGTLNLHSKTPSLIEFPPALQPIMDRVAGIDTLKKRSNSVVRSMPYTGFIGVKKVPMFPTMMTQGPVPEDDSSFTLNFWHHSLFPSMKVEDLLHHPERVSALQDKVVILGYTMYLRPWNYATTEQTTANTPLAGNANTYRDGTSLTYLAANASENLLHHHELHEVPVLVNILQTTLFALLNAWIWRYGAVLAPLIVTAAYACLIYCHGFIFSYLSAFVPLADTILFSVITLILGAIDRSRQDLQGYAKEQAQAESKQELAQVQSRFLNAFATSLMTDNQKILGKLRWLNQGPMPSPQYLQAVTSSLESCEEFHEYLTGIHQLSNVDSKHALKPARQRLRLRTIIDRIVTRFDAKIAHKQLSLTIDCPQDHEVESNAEIIDTIVFNFLSNAIKYSPNGSTIRITTERPEPKTMLIAVTDNGPGIAPEFHEKIFEKFYRVKDDQVYKVRGTGLGLFLCRYFAEQVGAEVFCRSKLGEGATFYLKI